MRLVNVIDFEIELRIITVPCMRFVTGNRRDHRCKKSVILQAHTQW
jgi:hypothetical protein